MNFKTFIHQLNYKHFAKLNDNNLTSFHSNTIINN